MKSKDAKPVGGAGGKIKNALYKKAVGYDSTETVEEYADNDGELVLVKKKVTTKNVPPDISAIKIMLGLDDDVTDLAFMSDEELERERKRLIKKIKEKTDDCKEKKIKS